ncbi:serine O-acetyltransferase EpsC [Brochothrix campestris]|uniref:Serine acetyltransferase n=1 Tax=Brochothrix campestris FSL F6-1037 TaxID=1265861 RepID=W7CW11_9LIST|nr:serine O-acetyltransferase EpsC [Brochothrix campestris]EUJ40850.1 serine acetyltransferase [Brochothrix campestris FSL F6-1037]
MFRQMKEQVDVVLHNDPAASSRLEVMLTYAGVHAIWNHRIAHFLYRHHLKLLARIISQMSRFFTGIEIHPGATIGRRLFIDHGMGLVIGETCRIGDDVTLHHGVTLGGTGHDTGWRHPIIKDRAFISGDVQILGPIVIGEDSKIGAGAVVIQDIPDQATAVGVPARVIRIGDRRVDVANKAKQLEERIDALTLELANLTTAVKKIREGKED